MQKITLIAGTRPNFIKLASIIRALESNPSISYEWIHTGQHYDEQMSQYFFKDLSIPEPNRLFTHTSYQSVDIQLSIIKQLHEYFSQSTIQHVMVLGDVHSTVLAATVAKQYCKIVHHVEAGLRSFDLTMPEEINRKLTDSISDYFYTTTEEAKKQLINEGQDHNRIFWVGNTMIDSLLRILPKATSFKSDSLAPKSFILLTLHRPVNVDDHDTLLSILNIIENNTDLPILFPVHPRTKKNIQHKVFNRIRFIDPCGYIDFIYLIQQAALILTDSGGIQEESTVLNIPCITYRTTTERPETIHVGTNILAKDLDELILALQRFKEGEIKTGRIPELWDGHAGERIVSILQTID